MYHIDACCRNFENQILNRTIMQELFYKREDITLALTTAYQRILLAASPIPEPFTVQV